LNKLISVFFLYRREGEVAVIDPRYFPDTSKFSIEKGYRKNCKKEQTKKIKNISKKEKVSVFFGRLFRGICQHIGSTRDRAHFRLVVSIRLRNLDKWFCLRRSKLQGRRRKRGI
jgi:hypothetical protein